MPNVRHIAASRFFYYTISNGCPSSISMLVHFKSPLKAQKLPEIPKSQAGAQGGPVFEVFRKFLLFVSIFQPADKKRTFRCPAIPPSMDARWRDVAAGDGLPSLLCPYSPKGSMAVSWIPHAKRPRISPRPLLPMLQASSVRSPVSILRTPSSGREERPARAVPASRSYWSVASTLICPRDMDFTAVLPEAVVPLLKRI